MKRINALALRQSLSRVVATLLRTGEPILLEKGRKPVAVIISLRDFQERFVEKAASDERKRLLAEIDRLARKSADHTPAVEVLRQVRSDG